MQLLALTTERYEKRSVMQRPFNRIKRKSNYLCTLAESSNGATTRLNDSSSKIKKQQRSSNGSYKPNWMPCDKSTKEQSPKPRDAIKSEQANDSKPCKRQRHKNNAVTATEHKTSKNSSQQNKIGTTKTSIPSIGWRIEHRSIQTKNDPQDQLSRSAQAFEHECNAGRTEDTEASDDRRR